MEATSERSGRSVAWATLGVCVLALVVHGFLAQRQKLPVVAPDEFLYENYARSLANGDGLTWRGVGQGLRSVLYVFLIAPSWLVSSGPGAYGIAKALGTAMVCLVAIPTWLLARRLLDPWLAFAATALTVAGSWMASAGLLLTENLALPLAVASMAAMVMALREPGSRWAWVALGLAAVGVLTRLQLVVLAPIFLAAILLDVLRRPRAERRARIERDRAQLAVLVVLCLAGAIVLAGSSSTLGLYAEVADYRPSVSRILAAAGQYGIGLTTMVAFVPAAATIALAARARNWRDERTGPLLCVLVAGTVLFVAEAAFFSAGFGQHWQIERYVAYVAPLALIAMFLAPGRISLLTGVAAAVGLAFGALLVEPIRNQFEQRSVYALTHEVHGVLPGLSRGVGLALIAAAVGIAGMVLLTRRAGSWAVAGPLACAALVLVTLGAESAGTWNFQLSVVSRLRDTMPAHLDWVDRATDGRVAMVLTSYKNPRNDITEFFNDRVARLYNGNPRLGVAGGACALDLEQNGALRVSGPGCDGALTTFLLVDPFQHLRFYGERQLANDPGSARLVRTPQPARLLAAISEPCVPRTLVIAGAATAGKPPPGSVPCQGGMESRLWLDRPGTLVVHFSGGTQAHYGRIGERVVAFPAGRPTAVRVPLPAGAPVVSMQLDWSSTAGAPALVGADLVQDGRTTRLL